MRSGTVDLALPWSWYSDPRTLPREQEGIFRRAWQYWGPLVFVIALDDQVGVEDRRLVESVQRSVASGLLDGGRLLAHFQELVRRALA